MTGKRWLGFGLAGFVVVALVVIGVQELDRSQAEAMNDTVAAEAGNHTTVYYFYGNYRCTTCTKFESYTDSVLHTDFGTAVTDGTIRWRPVNVEEPGMAHFVRDYSLFGKAVVLSEIKDGAEVRWKNLGEIWDRVGDEAGFREYIRTEVRAFLGPTS